MKEPQEMRGQWRGCETASHVGGWRAEGGTVVSGGYFLYVSVNEPKRFSDLYNDVRFIYNGARASSERIPFCTLKARATLITCPLDTCKREEWCRVVMKLLYTKDSSLIDLH